MLNADETLASLGLSRVNTATLARRERQATGSVLVWKFAHRCPSLLSFFARTARSERRCRTCRRRLRLPLPVGLSCTHRHLLPGAPTRRLLASGNTRRCSRFIPRSRSRDGFTTLLPFRVVNAELSFVDGPDTAARRQRLTATLHALSLCSTLGLWPPFLPTTPRQNLFASRSLGVSASSRPVAPAVPIRSAWFLEPPSRVSLT